jgi:hypothetical protein
MLLTCAIDKSKSWIQSSKNKNNTYPTYVKVRNNETGAYDIYKFDPNLLNDDNSSDVYYDDDQYYDAEDYSS